ncbi:hypothetical protein [Burkholderia thailandensis]|uniref:hypothetical protein n=1 Tax=Burkholderia thailandensis TaxID=57975 RepID=UPI002D78A81D|nr:hypothetical protein [Burkholderia thailandensis]WRS69975.1 hypothetical protein U9S59_29695 [Burkholderia thailandensis]
MDVPLIMRMMELEAEIARLREMYVEKKLKAELVAAGLAKTRLRPSRRREMVMHVLASRGVSIRLASEAFRISQTCYRYVGRRNAENDEIRIGKSFHRSTFGVHTIICWKPTYLRSLLAGERSP